MVTQHFALVRPMTVTENVVLGATTARVSASTSPRRRWPRPPSASGSGQIRRRASTVFPSVSSSASRSWKALYRDCRVLILDEPTAVLVPQEVDALFATLRRLRDDGMAIVFISHKLHEVRQISFARDGAPARRRRRHPRYGRGGRSRAASLMVGRPTMGVRRRGRARRRRRAARGGAVATRAARRLARGGRRRDPRRRGRVGQRAERARRRPLRDAPPGCGPGRGRRLDLTASLAGQSLRLGRIPRTDTPPSSAS